MYFSIYIFHPLHINLVCYQVSYGGLQNFNHEFIRHEDFLCFKSWMFS
jgi:hypothetical protein